MPVGLRGGEAGSYHVAAGRRCQQATVGIQVVDGRVKADTGPGPHDRGPPPLLATAFTAPYNRAVVQAEALNGKLAATTKRDRGPARQ